MKKKTFHNPIIKGGYPDPSICRAEDTYYMVASSFYYFPGLPIFRSRDLVHWEQIGNAVSRPDQVDFQDCDSSEGLWAATIRYHEGTFYIADMLDVKGCTCRYHFIITAKDPAGPWSDPVFVEGAEGIDPSLFFDREGRMWYCSNLTPDDLLYPEHKKIYACELDRETFQIKGEKHIIFDSITDHSFYTEAPHIYEIGDMYYLLTACGGTQTNHGVNIYRSKNILGPYEPCPRNPVITNRHIPLNNSIGAAVIGHGDLVQTQKGEWYMVLLGIRPYQKEGKDYHTNRPRKWIRKPDRNRDAQFNLGREVFLAPIAWDYDGWPMADNENGMVNLTERRPDLPFYRPPYQSRVDNFEAPELDMAWCMRRPIDPPFYSLDQRPGYLRMELRAVKAEEPGGAAMLVRRQQDNDFQAAAAMEFEPGNEGEEAGLIVTQNEEFSYLMVKEMQQGQVQISCYQVAAGIRERIASAPVKPGRLYLYLEGGEGSYSFYYGYQEKTLIPLSLDQDGSLLSTVVADGFIGSYLGMYGSGQPDSQNYADFDWFRYEVIEE
ncbi:MAG: glycoside hydrolase family 43 protein [Lachnospiraceae bacterium]|jgi:xylan 1,4-beta-xylosidase|nr:glycoside hydrolase family 43 protein [Lachnospiraceae bacterium]